MPRRSSLTSSAGGSSRPGAAGLRSRLTPLTALRSPEPCVDSVSSGEARPAAPRESERAIRSCPDPISANGAYCQNVYLVTGDDTATNESNGTVNLDELGRRLAETAPSST
ncbi:MAG: hypothetical protein ABSB96_05345 [Gaiellaceae bacterium]